MHRVVSPAMEDAEAACREAARCLGLLTAEERDGIAPLVVVDLLRLVAPHLIAVPIDRADGGAGEEAVG
jgi:hypothetical protein